MAKANLTSRCSSHATRAGQFLSRGFMVLLRKNIPQNHNLKTAAELGVRQSYMRIELGNENIPTTCECCGNKTKTVWGYAYKNEITLAAYFVQWTHEKPDHAPNFDFLIGTWGNNEINDKVLASWVYNTNKDGGSFMVIDSYNRPAAKSELCSRALPRSEVINNSEIMSICTEILDSIWLNDPRIIEITNFGKSAI